MNITSLEKVGKAWLGVAKAYKDLFFLELDLARRSFIPFCLIALLFIGVLGIFAITSLTVMVYLIYTHTHNGLIALGSAELVSVISIGLVFFFLRRYFNQLKFDHFRAQLKKGKYSKETQNEPDEITQAKD
ncbi:MAG: hypothetical protein K0R24_52 [Gammaproteobacteria bacterium]|jgi:uncharacterized membrane protein YqjE|nr:hypothetical protein [Gammaproteobacteria bacterium]